MELNTSFDSTLSQTSHSHCDLLPTLHLCFINAFECFLSAIVLYNDREVKNHYRGAVF